LIDGGWRFESSLNGRRGRRTGERKTTTGSEGVLGQNSQRATTVGHDQTKKKKRERERGKED